MFRKELTAPERDAHTTIYAGLVKKHGDVAKTNGGRPAKESPRGARTLTSQVATDLGITKDVVHARVARTARAAGIAGVTVDRSDGDTLISVGNAATENHSTRSGLMICPTVELLDPLVHKRRRIR